MRRSPGKPGDFTLDVNSAQALESAGMVVWQLLGYKKLSKIITFSFQMVNWSFKPLFCDHLIAQSKLNLGGS